MALVRPFTAEELAPFSFAVVRREGEPATLDVSEAHAAYDNLFLFLDGAKHVGAEFVDFEDQGWIASRGGTEHLLFGRLHGGLLARRLADGRILLHHVDAEDLRPQGRDPEMLVNTSLASFVRCFLAFRSIVDAGRRAMIERGNFAWHRPEPPAAAPVSREQLCEESGEDAVELDRMVRSVDPEAAAEGAFWGFVVFEMDEGFLPYAPGIHFYLLHWRLTNPDGIRVGLGPDPLRGV